MTTKGTKRSKVTKRIQGLFVFFVLFASFVVHTGTPLDAQLPPARLSFEVASVKRSPDPRSLPVFTPVVNQIRPGGAWRSSFATVLGLIRALYPGHSLPGQIAGPDWIATEFYDIEARGPASASPDDLHEMARTLLADRFTLAMRTEKRELSAYMLVIARADGRLGAGMTKPAIDCDAYRAARARGENPPGDPTRKPNADRLPCVSTAMPVFDHTRVIPGAEWRITAGGATIASIIPLLSRELGRPVVDMTGLTQSFDIEVQYSPEVPSPDRDVGPPLRAALADQLGLRVRDGRAAVDVLVIDRVERPEPD
jgi:uncharacterized protein (TIGR03435 family)